MRGSFCGSTGVCRGCRCKLALTRSVDFSCGSTSSAACSTMAGTYFHWVLCDEVIIHLRFDVNDSFWGEQLHEGLHSGGESRGTPLRGASPDDKQRKCFCNINERQCTCFNNKYEKKISLALHQAPVFMSGTGHTCFSPIRARAGHRQHLQLLCSDVFTQRWLPLPSHRTTVRLELMSDGCRLCNNHVDKWRKETWACPRH